ncbi:MAG TPA: ABC transporter permease [Candidatus Atribacteria bacterium]|nr:ABC transporter permease [Candidatus Atribacteria bacterium]
MRIFKDSPKFTVGIIIILLLIIIALLEPKVNVYRLNGHSSTEIGLYETSLPPSRDHPFGTDPYGRDVLSLILTGLKYSLLVGFTAGSLATIVAVVLATLAGYKGGSIDAFITTVSNAILVIPSWPIVAIIVLFVDKVNLLYLSLILAFFSWAGSSRQMKPQIASLKERPYVELAKVTGFSDLEIMFKEILPNFLPYIFVGFSYAVTGTMMAETALRLVGLGPADIPSLGQVLNWALYSGALAQGHYFLTLVPIVVLVLVFVSMNLINVGLDEVYNPRLKKITGV